MKVETRVLDVTSTLEGEKVGMSIDQSALSHIMSVLTDLYSDPELAVIREYSTNAFDAHVEAGIDRPIDVTLPSALSPFFKVRDYGFGLDANDIREIYSRYGTSTKRESNDVVGVLGLGCKSALTYTDQFTLVGFKDGIRTTVVVSRDEDGSGSMTIVDQSESDEESGVEVVVPANLRNSFDEKSNDFFKFWDEGKVLVNGDAPKRVDGIWIDDDLLLSKEVDTPTVVMGNVAYPMDGDTIASYRYSSGGYNLVAFVPIGAINFVPSREALQMTKRTKDTLAEIRERDTRKRKTTLMAMVEDAPSRHEAISMLSKARSILGFNVSGFDFKWNDEKIPTTFEGAMVVVEHPKRYRGKGWNFHTKINSNAPLLWVTGYLNDKFTPYKRQKLEKWIEQKNFETVPPNIAFVPQLPTNSEWINPDMIFDWAEINAIKIEREAKAERRDGKPKGSYSVFIGGKSQVGILAEDLVTEDLFWVEGHEARGRWSYHRRHHGINLLFQLHPQATLVTLPKNRIAKFQRDFPMAIEMKQYLKEAAIKWEKNIDKLDRIAYELQNGSYYDNYDDLGALDPTKIDDKALARAVKLFKRDLREFNKEASVYLDWIAISESGYKPPTKNYPLFDHLNLTRLPKSAMVEVYTYLNAAYAARKDS